jgi:hypothetical protein
MRVIRLLLGAATLASCQTKPATPDAHDTEAVVHERRVDAVPFHSVAVGAHTFALDSATLPEVVAALGAARVARQGDAGDAIASVCYLIQGKPAYTIAFRSDEMGGSELKVTEVALYAGDERADWRRSCGSLKAPVTSVDLGIPIGTTRQAVLRKLGVPEVDRGAGVRYARHERVTLPYTDIETGRPTLAPADVLAGIDLVYRGDSVVRVIVWRSTTF